MSPDNVCGVAYDYRTHRRLNSIRRDVDMQRECFPMNHRQSHFITIRFCDGFPLSVYPLILSPSSFLISVCSLPLSARWSLGVTLIGFHRSFIQCLHLCIWYFSDALRPLTDSLFFPPLSQSAFFILSRDFVPIFISEWHFTVDIRSNFYLYWPVICDIAVMVTFLVSNWFHFSRGLRLQHA